MMYAILVNKQDGSKTPRRINQNGEVMEHRMHTNNTNRRLNNQNDFGHVGLDSEGQWLQASQVEVIIDSSMSLSL